MLWRLSWKNVWRNKLRSIVVIIAITLGVFAGVFFMAFMNGMVEDRVNKLIGTEVAHIQVHKPEFLENSDFTLRISEADSLLNSFRTVPHVKAATKRIIILSMVASAETGTGVKINGVVPEEEQKVSNISERLISGNYFSGKQKNPVVIGKRLAEKLDVGLKNKIVITIQDASKDITSGAFRIAGIFETDNYMFDETSIFVRYDDLCRLSGLQGNEAHEIAILLDNNENCDVVKQALVKNNPDLEVKAWLEISPEGGYLVGMMDQYMAIFMIIILLALCFGIINTMLMVVLERIRELGMLMAVGMSKAKVFLMIMLETIYLSLTGGLAGIVLAYAVCSHFEKAGIDLYFWKDAFESVGYSSFVYPTIHIKMILLTSFLVVLTGVFSAIYPALKAIKLDPAIATRNE
jgi:ABC-type lipoprotein release transport system permease subunit